MLDGGESLDSALCRLSGARPPTPSVCSRSGRFDCSASTRNARHVMRRQFRPGQSSALPVGQRAIAAARPELEDHPSHDAEVHKVRMQEANPCIHSVDGRDVVGKVDVHGSEAVDSIFHPHMVAPRLVRSLI